MPRKYKGKTYRRRRKYIWRGKLYVRKRGRPKEGKNMVIKLYGTLICSRCKTAKLMLEHRGLKEGKDFEFITNDIDANKEHIIS